MIFHAATCAGSNLDQISLKLYFGISLLVVKPMPFALRAITFDITITKTFDVHYRDHRCYQSTVPRDINVRQLLETMLQKGHHKWRLGSIDYLLTVAKFWKYYAKPGAHEWIAVRSTKKIYNVSAQCFALVIVL